MKVTCKTIIGTFRTLIKLVTLPPSLVITWALLILLAKLGKNVYLSTEDKLASAPVCRHHRHHRHPGLPVHQLWRNQTTVGYLNIHT